MTEDSKREKKNVLELIEEMCPDEVEWKRLEECCNILDNRRKPVRKESRTDGQYPYYGANGIQDYVNGYLFDGQYVLIGEDGSVITKDGHPVVNYAEGKIWVNNHAHIIEENGTALLRYLFHFLQTVDISGYVHGSIPKFTGRDLKNIVIPIPPLTVQREVVRVLDTFTELTTELTARLTAELTARRKQYEYYRDEMLMLDGVEGVEWKRLGDVAISISSGKNKERLNNGEYPVYGSTGIISKTNTAFYDKEQILVARVGANAGYVHLANGQYDVSDNTLIVDVKPNYLLKYVYYSLVNMNLNQYAKGGGQPLIKAGDLKKLKIAIPEYEVQKRIVSVLDNFDAICTDLNIDLPAEIEARNKQYAYYRDLLLSFQPAQHSLF